MKKISIICCFILITVFSTGSYLIHTCYLNSYKKEFKSFIFANQKHTSTAVVLINPSELYTNSCNIIWEDENKEVLYKGVLYDIIRIENRGLKIALVVVSDEQETSLKKQFSELFDLNALGSAKNPFHILKSFFSLNCVINQADFDLGITSFLRPQSYSTDSFLISKVFLTQDTPPPDFSI